MNTRTLFLRSALIALLLAVLYGLGLAARLSAETTAALPAREAASAGPTLLYPIVALPFVLHAL